MIQPPKTAARISENTRELLTQYYQLSGSQGTPNISPGHSRDGRRHHSPPGSPKQDAGSVVSDLKDQMSQGSDVSSELQVPFEDLHKLLLDKTLSRKVKELISKAILEGDASQYHQFVNNRRDKARARPAPVDVVAKELRRDQNRLYLMRHRLPKPHFLELTPASMVIPTRSGRSVREEKLALLRRGLTTSGLSPFIHQDLSTQDRSTVLPSTHQQQRELYDAYYPSSPGAPSYDSSSFLMPQQSPQTLASATQMSAHTVIEQIALVQSDQVHNVGSRRHLHHKLTDDHDAGSADSPNMRAISARGSRSPLRDDLMEQSSIDLSHMGGMDDDDAASGVLITQVPQQAGSHSRAEVGETAFEEKEDLGSPERSQQPKRSEMNDDEFSTMAEHHSTTSEQVGSPPPRPQLNSAPTIGASTVHAPSWESQPPHHILHAAVVPTKRNKSRTMNPKELYCQLIQQDKRKRVQKLRQQMAAERHQIETLKAHHQEAIITRMQLKKQLEGFRQRLKVHLEEIKHPLRGAILRCVDDSMVFHLLQRYDGFSLSPEAILMLLGNALGTSVIVDPTKPIQCTKDPTLTSHVPIGLQQQTQIPVEKQAFAQMNIEDRKLFDVVMQERLMPLHDAMVAEGLIRGNSKALAHDFHSTMQMNNYLAFGQRHPHRLPALMHVKKHEDPREKFERLVLDPNPFRDHDRNAASLPRTGPHHSLTASGQKPNYSDSDDRPHYNLLPASPPGSPTMHTRRQTMSLSQSMSALQFPITSMGLSVERSATVEAIPMQEKSSLWPPSHIHDSVDSAELPALMSTLPPMATQTSSALVHNVPRPWTTDANRPSMYMADGSLHMSSSRLAASISVPTLGSGFRVLSPHHPHSRSRSPPHNMLPGDEQQHGSLAAVVHQIVQEEFPEEAALVATGQKVGSNVRSSAKHVRHKSPSQEHKERADDLSSLGDEHSHDSRQRRPATAPAAGAGSMKKKKKTKGPPVPQGGLMILQQRRMPRVQSPPTITTESVIALMHESLMEEGILDVDPPRVLSNEQIEQLGRKQRTADAVVSQVIRQKKRDEFLQQQQLSQASAASSHPHHSHHHHHHHAEEETEPATADVQLAVDPIAPEVPALPSQISPTIMVSDGVYLELSDELSTHPVSVVDDQAQQHHAHSHPAQPMLSRPMDVFLDVPEPSDALREYDAQQEKIPPQLLFGAVPAFVSTRPMSASNPQQHEAVGASQTSDKAVVVTGQTDLFGPDVEAFQREAQQRLMVKTPQLITPNPQEKIDALMRAMSRDEAQQKAKYSGDRVKTAPRAIKTRDLVTPAAVRELQQSALTPSLVGRALAPGAASPNKLAYRGSHHSRAHPEHLDIGHKYRLTAAEVIHGSAREEASRDLAAFEQRTAHIHEEAAAAAREHIDPQQLPAVTPYSSFNAEMNVINSGVAAGAGLMLWRPREVIRTQREVHAHGGQQYRVHRYPLAQERGGRGQIPVARKSQKPFA